MSEAYDSLRRALDEALECAKGGQHKAIVHDFTALDVKDIRAELGMSQSQFAAAFGISVSTLRHWERGDRVPHGPARVLLNVVAKEPDAVLRALQIREP